MSGGATIIAPRSTFQNLSSLCPVGTRTATKGQNFLVPNFYGSYQITDNLTAGIGIYEHFGLGTKWPADWVGRGSAIETSNETLYDNPAIGYISPELGNEEIRIRYGMH